MIELVQGKSVYLPSLDRVEARIEGARVRESLPRGRAAQDTAERETREAAS
jgi:hypothetical protein